VSLKTKFKGIYLDHERHERGCADKSTVSSFWFVLYFCSCRTLL